MAEILYSITFCDAQYNKTNQALSLFFLFCKNYSNVQKDNKYNITIYYLRLAVWFLFSLCGQVKVSGQSERAASPRRAFGRETWRIFYRGLCKQNIILTLIIKIKKKKYDTVDDWEPGRAEKDIQRQMEGHLCCWCCETVTAAYLNPDAQRSCRGRWCCCFYQAGAVFANRLIRLRREREQSVNASNNNSDINWTATSNNCFNSGLIFIHFL